MQWPEDLEDVHAVGFSDMLIPILMNAIDSDHVKWSRVITSRNPRAEGRYREFDYLGFRYGLDESFEAIPTPTGEDWDYVGYRIEKIAKLDVDDHGETIVLETYPITSPKQPQPKPQSPDWGTF